MKIHWSDYALNALIKTTDYITEEFGNSARRKFITAVRKTNSLIKNQPKIGRVEPLLEDAALEFRSARVTDINRIIYYIGSSEIEIVDFWDARRDPEKQAERLLK